MKYAKKFKLVPYTNETPAASQIVSTFNNALTTDKYPDEKVKIYNQALSKIKDLNPANLSAIESKNYEEDDEISGESAEARKDRIAKEIDKLEKYTTAYNASKTVQDYSNSDFLKTKKFKEKSKFDNEKFMTLLDDLVKNNNTVTTRLQDIYNLINAKVPQLSNTGLDWEAEFPQTGKKTPAVRLTLKRPNETTVKTENDEDNLYNEDGEDDHVPSEVTYIKSKPGNNLSRSNSSSNNTEKDINNQLVNSVINQAQQYYNINPNISNTQSNTGSPATTKKNKSTEFSEVIYTSSEENNNDNDLIVSTSPSSAKKNKSISFSEVINSPEKDQINKNTSLPFLKKRMVTSTALKPSVPLAIYSKNDNAIPFNLDTSDDLSILDNTPSKKKRTSEQQRMKNQKSNERRKEKREKSRLQQSVQSENPVQATPFEQPEKEEEEEDTPPPKRNIKSADITQSNILSSSSKRKKNIKK